VQFGKYKKKMEIIKSILTFSLGFCIAIVLLTLDVTLPQCYDGDKCFLDYSKNKEKAR